MSKNCNFNKHKEYIPLDISAYEQAMRDIRKEMNNRGHINFKQQED